MQIKYQSKNNKMKKLHLLVGLFLFIGCLQVHAEKSRVAMEKWQTGNVVGSTTVCRSPMRISIDVYYDDELRQIEISSDVGVEVQLFLYDINGNTLDYSHCINTVLDIPYRYSGIIILRI